MNKHIIKQSADYSQWFFEGQNLKDPFMPDLRSNTLEHQNRLRQGEISQKLLKNEENES